MESAVSVDERRQSVAGGSPHPHEIADVTSRSGPGRVGGSIFTATTRRGAGLAWCPTLTGSFHTPERFGWIELTGP